MGAWVCTAAGIDDRVFRSFSPILALGLSLENRGCTYVWNTDKELAGTYRQLEIKLAEGTRHLCHFPAQVAAAEAGSPCPRGFRSLRNFRSRAIFISPGTAT